MSDISLSSVTLKNIGFSYGTEPVLENLSCGLLSGKITVFLGPSGCGKTTLLRLLAGLLKPHEGEIIYHRKNSVSGEDQAEWSYLFQEPRLLPWLTVAQNIDFVLRDRFPAGSGPLGVRPPWGQAPLGSDPKRVGVRHQAAFREERCRHFLEMVELADAAEQYPHELSGGMRQRAAMARAFAWGGEGLLLDEPFQALDLRLKRNLIASFQGLWQKEGRGPCVLVTHDLPEALLLGDEIILLTRGPARVAGRWTNPLAPEARRWGHSELLSLESQLYRGFLEEA